MRLYHGSNMGVREPVLMPLVRALDFGRGFYVTTNLDQAAKWARTSVLRRGEGTATVSCFEFDEGLLIELRHLHFSGPNAEWLRFVSRNRNQGIDDSGRDIRHLGERDGDGIPAVIGIHEDGVR